MLMPNSNPAWDNRTDRTGTLEGQARVYLRGYYRLLKARPTALQLAAMKTSALAAARFDRALRDDSLSGATLAHYERTSRKAHARMLATFPKRPQQPVLSPLAAYLARGRSHQGADDDA